MTSKATYLVIATLALLCKPAYAQESNLEKCRSLAGAAESVMRNRQGGVDVVEMYEIAQKADPSVSAMMTEIVTMAYEQPKYSGEEYKAQAISEFKSKMMTQCMRANSG
jgi:hypothetical protein